MEIEQNTLRGWILTPLTVALLLILAVFVSWAVVSENERRHHAQNDLSKRVEAEFKMSENHGLTSMVFRLDEISRREDIANVFVLKDRPRLLALTKPLYDDLNAKYKITHFYITGPDRVNFLRVHQPNRHGDIINRITTLEAEKRQEAFSGLELGPLGTFTLRHVKPFFGHGKLLGYLELGMEIEHLLPRITDETNAEVSIILHKNFLDRETWERGMKSLGRDADWDRYKNVALIYETPRGLQRSVSMVHDHIRPMEHGNHQKFTEEGRVFDASLVHIMDAGNREVGNLVIVNDITDIASASQLKIITIITVCIAAMVLYFIWLYPFLGRVQLRLQKGQQDLLEQDERIRALVNSSAIGFLVGDAQGICTFCNRAALDILGYEEEELVGKPVHDKIHHSHADGSPYPLTDCPSYKTIASGEGSPPHREVYWHRDGHAINISFETQPIFSGDEVIGCIANFRDIGEDILMEHHIKERMKELNCLFELSRILTSPDLTLEQSLPRIAEELVRALQYPDVTAVRISFDDKTYATPNFRETPWRMVSEIEVADETVGTIEVIYLEERPEEVEGPFLVEERTLIDEISRRIGNKITNLREAEGRATIERELEHASKLEAVGQLAGGIAHEINTPTQFIGDNLRFLEDACVDVNEMIDSYEKLAAAAHAAGGLEDEVATVKQAAETADLEYIKDEISQAITQSLGGIEQISRIVLSMKEFSHPSTKEKSAVDINKALETTITVSRNEWKYASDLETDFAADLPMVSGLPGELNQVFLNLIVNAVHAIQSVIDTTKGGGKGLIMISTRQEGDRVVIRMKDTGGGIPKDIRDKVFEQFFTTKEVGKGTGQGLSICYDIIANKHNGKIYFETEEGQGTTFIIRLPIDGGENGFEVIK